MGFLKSKPPKVVPQTVAAAAPAAPPAPAATPAVQVQAVQEPAAAAGLQASYGTEGSTNIARQPGSLIATSAQGLTRKAFTRKPSLIGGGGIAN